MINKISIDIIQVISQYLTPNDLVSLSATSKSLNKKIDKDFIKFLANNFYPFELDNKELKLIKNTKWNSLELKKVLVNPNIEEINELFKFNNVIELYIDNAEVNMNLTDTDIKEFKNFKNLKKLTLYECNDIYDVSTLGNIPNLKLDKCNNIYDLKGLDNVINLDIDDCIGIDEIPILNNLKTLYLRYGSFNNLNNLQHIDLECLELYNIIYNNYCNNYCNNYKFIDNIPIIHLYRIDIKDVSYLQNLSYVSLDECNSITDISGLKTLKTLKIYSCIKLKKIENLENLENLEIFQCFEIKSISNLKKLKYLEIGECQNIVNISNFNNLDIVSLMSLKKLKKILNFTNINTLYLYNMKNYDFLNIDKIKNIYFDEYNILK